MIAVSTSEREEEPKLIRRRTRRGGTVRGVQVGPERIRWIVATEQGSGGHFATLCPGGGRRRVWTRLVPAGIR